MDRKSGYDLDRVLYGTELIFCGLCGKFRLVLFEAGQHMLQYWSLLYLFTISSVNLFFSIQSDVRRCLGDLEVEYRMELECHTAVSGENTIFRKWHDSIVASKSHSNISLCLILAVHFLHRRQL